MKAQRRPSDSAHGISINIDHPLEDQEPDIDLERIAAPIAGDAVEGESLIYDTLYDEIKECAREDDPNLPQGVWVTDLKYADWDAARELCSEALYTRTKDLQIASWLLETLVYTHGFSGLVRGLRVIDSLVSNYWETMYPKIEDDDLDFRLSPFYWIDEKLPTILLRLPFVAPQSPEFSPYCTFDWTKMLWAENEQKKAGHEAPTDKYPTRGVILKSFNITSDEYYQSIIAHIDDAKKLIGKIEGALTKHCGKETPYLNHTRKAIDDVETLVASLTKKRLFGGVKKKQVVEPQSKSGTLENHMKSKSKAAGAKSSASAGEITTREEAYQRLTEAADFLIMTEPHSPTPYLVKRAVRWGAMPFHKLLEEFVDEDSRLNQLSSLLGIKEEVMHTGAPGQDDDEDN